MKEIRFGLILIWMLLCTVISAQADVNIGIGLPSVSIGINLPLFPELVRVPGYPVYYAPRMEANYFFYDGMYWVYENDSWYASSWYNGPWGYVGPEVVPLFILRIPVRYYRQPPLYFRSWQSDAPPRWGQHWGHGWEQRRRGWDSWKRGSAPAPAPLPVYQRQYSGDRYPRPEQQHNLRSKSYRYQPREKAVQQHLNQLRAPAPAQRGREESAPARREPQRSTPLQQSAPADQRSQPQKRGGENVQRPGPDHTPPQQRSPAPEEQRQRPEAVPQREQQAPRANDREQRQQHEPKATRPQVKEQKPQDRGESQEPDRGHGKGQSRDDDRGRGRDK